MYYDLHMMPEAHILAATFTPNKPSGREGRRQPSVYEHPGADVTYEKENHRAFVSILAISTRPSTCRTCGRCAAGIAWRASGPMSTSCANRGTRVLAYPEGGPTAPEKAAPNWNCIRTSNLAGRQRTAHQQTDQHQLDAAGRCGRRDAGISERPPRTRAEMRSAPWKDSGFRVRRPTRIDRPSTGFPFSPTRTGTGGWTKR